MKFCAYNHFSLSLSLSTPPLSPPSLSHPNHDDVLPRSTGVNASSQNVMTSSHGGITSSISTHVPHHIGHHPAVTASTGVQFHHPASGQFISVAPSSVSGAYHHPTVATAQTQFANPSKSVYITRIIAGIIGERGVSMNFASRRNW